MRLLSYELNGESAVGAVVDDGVVNITKRLGEGYGSLREILIADRIDAVRAAIRGTLADHSLSEVRYLPTVPNPEKIICIGVNYVNRNAEYKDDSALPKFPSVFMRTRESLVGHNEPLVRPPESNQLDYEGEIAIVIGREGRRIPEHEASAHIAGLSLLNEGSIRDWLRHAKFNVTQGKNFEKSGSLGPWMVTADEFSDYTNLSLGTHVNGEQRQFDTTANLLFPFNYLISYLSTFMRLKPGDIISTGTPNGAGARFDPPKYLKPGDVVEIDSPTIGVLSNGIVDEQI
ncbi:MAG: 2-keto-4-pentenoate hydratase/2-oxohepta-3-ene-1,7-dioic acid hydratase in catechol pathway [Gammaproteobacteria bacterium]|jgi:2-keto-4-pentenoate hydratase/2-oxohepta-3-ene-1,7-dioic acid hydratase in catechol pathway